MVSDDRAGSVKKQASEPVVKARPLLRMPGVVVRPFTTEQSPPGGIAGPTSLRKNVEPPNPLVHGDPRPRIPIANCDSGENEGATIPTVQSPPEDQSVASNTIRVVFVVAPTAIDPSISVAFFASVTPEDGIGDQDPVHAYKFCDVIRPATPRTSS